MDDKTVEQHTDSADNDSLLDISRDCDEDEECEDCEAVAEIEVMVDDNDKYNSSDLGGIYDSEVEDSLEDEASGGLSIPEEPTKQLRDIFPNVPPAMLKEIANRNDTIENAIDQVLNCSVEGRVSKSLVLLQKDELFKKVTLTEKRNFDPDDPLEQKFRLAKGHYLSLSGRQAHHIETIDYIENRILMEIFENKKDQFRFEGKDPKECLLFHGTSSDNIDNILEENFRIDLAGKHGQAYGEGIYFSEKTAIPDKYSVGNKKALLLCRVLLGNEFLGTGNIPEGFDSKSVNPDQDNRAAINIIKDVDQILPCFVLNFAPPHYAQSLPLNAAAPKRISSAPEWWRNWKPNASSLPLEASNHNITSAPSFPSRRSRNSLPGGASGDARPSVPNILPRQTAPNVPLGARAKTKSIPSYRAVLRGSKASSLPVQDSTASLPSQDSTASLPSQDSTASLPSQHSTASLPSQHSTASLPTRVSTSTDEADVELAIKLSLSSTNLDVMTEEDQMELAINLSLVSSSTKGDKEEMEQLRQAVVLSLTERGDSDTPQLRIR